MSIIKDQVIINRNNRTKSPNFNLSEISDKKKLLARKNQVKSCLNSQRKKNYDKNVFQKLVGEDYFKKYYIDMNEIKIKKEDNIIIQILNERNLNIIKNLLLNEDMNYIKYGILILREFTTNDLIVEEYNNLCKNEILNILLKIIFEKKYSYNIINEIFWIFINLTSIKINDLNNIEIENDVNINDDIFYINEFELNLIENVDKIYDKYFNLNILEFKKKILIFYRNLSTRNSKYLHKIFFSKITNSLLEQNYNDSLNYELLNIILKYLYWFKPEFFEGFQENDENIINENFKKILNICNNFINIKDEEISEIVINIIHSISSSNNMKVINYFFESEIFHNILNKYINVRKEIKNKTNLLRSVQIIYNILYDNNDIIENYIKEIIYIINNLLDICYNEDEILQYIISLIENIFNNKINDDNIVYDNIILNCNLFTKKLLSNYLYNKNGIILESIFNILYILLNSKSYKYYKLIENLGIINTLFNKLCVEKDIKNIEIILEIIYLYLIFCLKKNKDYSDYLNNFKEILYNNNYPFHMLLKNINLNLIKKYKTLFEYNENN